MSGAHAKRRQPVLIAIGFLLAVIASWVIALGLAYLLFLYLVPRAH